MKTMILALALTLAALQAEARICFKAKTAAPPFVPKAICFDSLNIQANGGSSIITTEKSRGVSTPLQVPVFSRHNEERIRFQAVGTLVAPKEIGCFIMDSAIMVLNGEVNSSYEPSIHPNLLSLKVQYSFQTDLCHNPRRVGQVEYALVR